MTPEAALMAGQIVSGVFRILLRRLAAAGLAALLLIALIATPLVAPPELRSISAARGTVDSANNIHALSWAKPGSGS